MNPAAEIRARVQDRHPGAIVVERTRNSIRHRLPDAPDGRQRFALDTSVGPMHYGPNADQEIDTAFRAATAPWDWEMTNAAFEVRALSDLSAGQVIEYRKGDEWVRFQPMALQYSNALGQIQSVSMPESVQAAANDDTLTWTDGYGAGRSLSWQAQTARLMKLLTISSAASLPAPSQFIIDGGEPVIELAFIFAFSSGVTPYVNGQPWGRGSQTGDRDTQGLVEFRNDAGDILWWFNLPRSWDSDGNEQLGLLRFKRQGKSLFVSHRVPLAFIQSAVYPLFVDVTIDEQVGARGDDGFYRADCAFFDTYGADMRLGQLSGIVYQQFYRFTGISGLSGATIDVAYVQLKAYQDGLGFVWLTTVYADDSAAPAAPTTCADANGKTRTTAGVSWNPPAWLADTWYQSPSIVSIIQELANSYDPSAIQILHDDNGTPDSNRIYTKTYDSVTTDAPKLHIEYTVGAPAAAVGAVGDFGVNLQVIPARVVGY